VGPPPGFGQGGPQFGQQNFQNQFVNQNQHNQQQPGPMGGQGPMTQGMPRGVAGFIDYMGSSGQFGPVGNKPTPASERGYSFPNQDPNFGQATAGLPANFMLQGMLGFQSTGQNRGPGGNTSGYHNGSQNPDPYASISLTWRVHPTNNSNNQHNHNDFGRNPYRLEGIKDFGAIPILGEQAMWSEWKLLIDGLILCQTWAWTLFDTPVPFMAWHTTKMFLAKSLSKSDKHIVFRSENWLAAMHNLKHVHAPDDDNSADAITEKMITARLGDREAAST
jgi:hypothetical protein